MAKRYKTIEEYISTWLDGFQGGNFSKSTVIDEIGKLFTDPTKKEIKPLLSNLVDKAVDMGLDYSDLPPSSIEEFLIDYHRDEPVLGTVIQVDCKLDMAIPTESLQENLQLLIDRHGVQEVSNLIEQLTEGNVLWVSPKDSKALSNALENPPEPNNALKQSLTPRYSVVLEYLDSLDLMINTTIYFDGAAGYKHDPTGTGVFMLDPDNPKLSVHSNTAKDVEYSDLFDALLNSPDHFKEVYRTHFKNLLKLL